MILEIFSPGNISSLSNHEKVVGFKICFYFYFISMCLVIKTYIYLPSKWAPIFCVWDFFLILFLFYIKFWHHPGFQIAEMGMKTHRRTPYLKLKHFHEYQEKHFLCFVISFLFLNDNVTKHTDHSLGRRGQMTTLIFGSRGLMHNLNIFAFLVFNLKLRLQK